MQHSRVGSPGGGRREHTAAFVAAIIIVGGISWWASGRDAGADVDDANDPVALEKAITLDPDVRTDTLANGLRYYVRANDYPEARAELRLVVDAGSVHEDDDQRGLAHAVEHMAFRGTRRFPGRSIEAYLRSIGMRLGDDLNATTSYDETVYRLTVPTDRSAELDSAIMMLADWAHAVTFDSAAARQEAPIVFEEWRTYRNARERLSEARDTLVLRGSRYATRGIIGDTTTLRRFDVAAMRRFYRDWYRPDRMAVVVVGDIDVRIVERTLRRELGAIPRATAQRPAPLLEKATGPDGRVVLLTDPEVAGTRASFWFPRTPVGQRTIRDFRALLVERIARAILRDRLAKEAGRAGSSLLSAGTSVRRPVRALEAQVVGGDLVEGQVIEGIETLVAVVERLRKYGPRVSELTAVKEETLRESRESLSTSDESSDIAEALARHYLSGEPVPGTVTESRWTNDLLRGISAREVMAFFEPLAPARAQAILLTSPPNAMGKIDVRLVTAAVDSAMLGIDDEKADSTAITLMRELPSSGPIASRRTLAKIDVQEWRLANGMRVLLKPTDFADDHVELRLSAAGGASIADREDYPSAYLADDILEATGAGEWSGAQIARFLDDRAISLAPVVRDERIEVLGSGRRADLESMLQLSYLYLTSPREDREAFRRYRERIATYARNRAVDPDAAFDDTVAATLQPSDVRALHNSPAFVEQVDLAKALRFWRARAASATNFTAVIVGDFEIWRAAPLVERYLGSLPAGQAERPAALRSHRPESATSHTFRRGIEPSAVTRIVMGDTMALTLESDAGLDVVRDLVEVVLHERLREQLGGTYGVSVDVETWHARPSSFAFTIEFTASPDRVDTLAAAALAEIERLRVRGPTDDEASKVRKAAIAHTDAQSQGNRYWAGELAWHALVGWNLESIAKHADDAEAISPSMLRAACARYLDGRRFVRVTRLPDIGISPLREVAR
jgi:zinc protease